MVKESVVFFYLYVLFSLLGWLLEVAFRSWKSKRFVNPGFLRGPYLPLYGMGALLLALAATHMNEAELPVKVIIYFVITSGSEFLTGFAFEHFFHKRLWDYSQEPFCVMKHICLGFSLCWVMLAFAYEYLFLPAALSFLHAFPHILPVIVAIGGLMFIDALLQFTRFYRGRYPGTGPDKEGLWEDYSRLVGPLVKHPQVASLECFMHHRSTTRLDHSLKVSWLSYQMARRLSLDGAAAARGGVLHDLFYYEWLTEGPRLHGFRHPRICLENARQVVKLSATEEDVILKHMWPLTFIPPRYAEAWIVCFVDTYCTLLDYLALFGTWGRTVVSADREL
ncbi:MAG: phosphohydrolase [Syntrophales bacterium]